MALHAGSTWQSDVVSGEADIETETDSFTAASVCSSEPEVEAADGDMIAAETGDGDDAVTNTLFDDGVNGINPMLLAIEGVDVPDLRVRNETSVVWHFRQKLCLIPDVCSARTNPLVLSMLASEKCDSLLPLPALLAKRLLQTTTRSRRLRFPRI